MPLPRLHGIVPPLPTPLLAGEAIDTESLARLVEFQIEGGVHGLWVLGTTARFEMIPVDRQRQVAEIVATKAAGRLPLVLNVSEQGVERTLEHARRFDDLPYDYYAALPPWYQPMAVAEVVDYFQQIADRLSKPLVIYNAPWVCNQLGFPQLRQLADHPRIVGCKDVWTGINRSIDWPVEERRRQNYSYLHGNDLVGLSTELGSDGFVISLANAFPEIAVALWDAARAGDAERAFRLQSQFARLARATGLGPMLACLEVMCRHRGLLDRMLPAPLRSLDADAASRVIEAIEAVGMLPESSAKSNGRRADLETSTRA
ncbi:dihydrodipicolinate synthase family protein [Singulisphaera sp. PoT]|uniref:dihydrodipicolinate synthase family protein n=1 Tax=Singulisphaera sp. PoT TaxID=3411797 RepID=UPI003BF5BC27